MNYIYNQYENTFTTVTMSISTWLILRMQKKKKNTPP